MIVKLEELNSNQLFECDVCIVGGGPAGITLAKKLGDYGIKVILCEAGDLEYSQQSQDCYKGKINGDAYFPLDIARLRFLGGTSNHWGGWCRYFEEIDFKRNYLNRDLEWPIKKKDLDGYFSEACNILGIDKNFDEKIYNFNGIKKISYKISEVNFKDKYLNYFEESKNVKIILNSNLIDVKAENKKIKNLYFKSYKDKIINIKSVVNIFSMGGIENSRILLWFYEKYKENFCSSKIPIGKYWMEHPHHKLGDALVKKEVLDAKHFSILKDNQIQEKILGCSITVSEHNYATTQKLAADLLCVAPKIGKKIMESIKKKKLYCGIQIKAAWEQQPVETNKITLSKIDKDKFETPRPILNWKKNELDRKTIVSSVNIFDKWIKNNELGRIKLNSWFINGENYPEDDMIGGNHHMGGTRMGADILTSVVDYNCKLHGNDNLYIGGSSIFRTGGHNNPTLPIIQLSLRLADHLKKQFL